MILHYHATQRDDSGFWNYVRHMPIPDSLRERVDLFRSRARISGKQEDLFAFTSWAAVMLGQGIVPSGYDPMADQMPIEELAAKLAGMRGVI